MSETKRDYQEWLNELGVPQDDQKSNGGRIPDNADYGDWLRRNDPIAFNVGYGEWSREIVNQPVIDLVDLSKRKVRS